MDQRQAVRRTRREAGFTLMELVVTSILLTFVLVAALTLFDFNTRLSRVQTAVADMQQSLRIAQMDMVRLTRMAGRGGLPTRQPGFLLPNGLALSVQNNVAGATKIGDQNSPTVMPGTDVLTVRGVFNSPIYLIDIGDPLTFQPGGDGIASGGVIMLRNVSPTGVPQDLGPIIEAIDEERNEALVLVSPLSQLAVVELIPDLSESTLDATNQIKLAYRFDGTDLADDYRALSGGVFPANMNNVAMVGMLEEHRFYVRQDFAIAGDTDSAVVPVLSRARPFPGSQVPYEENAANWSVDVADQVLDLQVTLGLDVDNDGMVEEADNRANDEWLFNDPADGPTQAKWNTVPNVVPAVDTPLFYVRLTTLARTAGRDLKYQAPLLTRVEDHDYLTDPDAARFNEPQERNHRRRLLRTVIDLRNL